MKKILALLLALCMIFSLAACGQAAKPAAAGDLVGVAMPTKDLQRWNQDGENMKAMLEKAGYQVDLQYGANDIATQVSQIENMIANGCKVLVIASIDGDSLGTVLAQAKEKNIPVIAYDRLIMNSDAVSYYATFDNWLVGTKQGEFIEAELGLKDGKGPYNIEFITGDPGDNNINFFFDGAMSILQQYLDNGQLVCPSGQTEKAVVATQNWATDAAQARFENILSSYYADKQLDAVLASNDSTACGVENALASSYSGKWPVITGQDCDIAIMGNLIAGKQGMSVFKDTRTLAAKVVEMVDALMKGQEPPINDTETYNNGVRVVPSFLCEPVACTVDNYKELLIDSGYYTYDQLGIDPNAAPAEARTFIMGIDPEYPPFSYMGDDGEYTGFDVEVCQAVCDYLGWDMEIFAVNWDEKLIQLDSMECDCVWSGMTILDTMTEAGYVISAPYFDSTQVLVVKADSGIASSADLAGKVVAVQLGTSGETLLNTDLADLTATFGDLMTCNSFLSCFTELGGGAADAVFVDLPVAAKFCSENEGYTIINENLGSEQYGIAFRSGDADLCAQVEAAVAALVADGTYAEIASKEGYEDIVNNLIFLG